MDKHEQFFRSTLRFYSKNVIEYMENTPEISISDLKMELAQTSKLLRFGEDILPELQDEYRRIAEIFSSTAIKVIEAGERDIGSLFDHEKVKWVFESIPDSIPLEVVRVSDDGGPSVHYIQKGEGGFVPLDGGKNDQ